MAEKPKPPTRESKPPGEDVSPWALAGLGTQFFVAILFFAWGGSWLDRRFGTAPLFLLGGVLIGGGGSFYLSYRRLTAPASAHRSDREPPSHP